MITIQIIAGSSLLIFGILVMKFSKQIAKHIPFLHINQITPSKTSGKRVEIESTNKFYGEEKGHKLVFWVFGVLPLILGLIILVTGLLNISIFTE